MGILDDKTPAQQAAETLVKHVNSHLAVFANQYKRAFDMVWNRTDGITPQDVLDAFDTDAMELFIRSAATRDYILSAKPSLLPEEYRTTPFSVSPEIVDGAPTGRMIVG